MKNNQNVMIFVPVANNKEVYNNLLSSIVVYIFW